MEIIYNSYYDKKEKSTPFASIITPVYNRKDVLPRALRSVMKQSYKEIEHIIINDGSTENLDFIMDDYMNAADYPVVYIKKENGGVHTARNAGRNVASGYFCINLDSDDELAENAVQRFRSVWNSLSVEDKDKDNYCGIVSMCIDENGRTLGPKFADNLNELPWEEARSSYKQIHFEHLGCVRTELFKTNPVPEPKGVTFVTENIQWSMIDKKYKYYFINDELRVYHTETEESYTHQKRKNRQNLRNQLWNCTYMVNRTDIYNAGGGVLSFALI